MESRWLYERRGRRLGPISDDDLQALLWRGDVNGETRVWRSGLSEWIPIGSIPEFQSPPPLPGRPPLSFNRAWLPPFSEGPLRRLAVAIITFCLLMAGVVVGLLVQGTPIMQALRSSPQSAASAGAVGVFLWTLGAVARRRIARADVSRRAEIERVAKYLVVFLACLFAIETPSAKFLQAFQSGGHFVQFSVELAYRTVYAALSVTLAVAVVRTLAENTRLLWSGAFIGGIALAFVPSTSQRVASLAPQSLKPTSAAIPPVRLVPALPLAPREARTEVPSPVAEVRTPVVPISPQVVLDPFAAYARGHRAFLDKDYIRAVREFETAIAGGLINEALRANIGETVDPLEFSVQGGEAKRA